MKSLHVLIIGGGLGGLVLAQALRKQGISFQVFERDSNDHSRVQGWALTLEELERKLPNDLGPFEQTRAVRNTNVRTGATLYRPDGEMITTIGDGPKGQDGYMIRCNRTQLRETLAQHLRIEWNKKSTRYEETDNGVTAYFEDGSSVSGDFLVGADGWHNPVRKQLLQANPGKPLPAPYGIIIGEVTVPKGSCQQEPKTDLHSTLSGVMTSTYSPASRAFPRTKKVQTSTGCISGKTKQLQNLESSTGLIKQLVQSYWNMLKMLPRGADAVMRSGAVDDRAAEEMKEQQREKRQRAMAK